MADTTHQIKIETVYDDKASAEIKKSKLHLVNFEKAAEKAGDELKDLGNKHEKAGKKSAVASKKMSAGLSDIKAGTVAALAATAGLTAGIIKAAAVMIESQKIARQFAFALEQSGVKSIEAREKFEDLANAMSTYTIHTDEAIKSLGALLLAAGVPFDKLEQATKVVVDLSAALGRELEPTAIQIAKTFAGTAGEAGDLAAELKTMSQDALKAGGALDVLEKKFSGTARVMGGTLSGSIQIAKNSFEELVEQTTRLVFNKDVTTWLSGIIGKIQELTGAVDQMGHGASMLKQFEEQLKDLRRERAALEKESAQIAIGMAGPARASYQPASTRNANELYRTKKDIRDLERSILSLRTKSEEVVAKEVETSKRLRKITADQVKLAQDKLAFGTEFDAFRKQVKEESMTRLEAIEEEGKARRAMLERAVVLGVKFEKGEKEKLLTSIAKSEKLKREEVVDDLAMKQMQANQLVLDKYQRAAQETIASIQNPARNLFGMVGGAVGGAFGGPAGAALGSEIGKMVADLGPMLATITKSGIETAIGAIKGVGEMVLTLGMGFSFWKGLFSSRKYYTDIGSAVGEFIDKTMMADHIKDMSESLRSTADAFRDVATLLARAKERRTRTTGGTGDAVENFLDQFDVRFEEWREWFDQGAQRTNRRRYYKEMSVMEALEQGYDVESGEFALKNVEEFEAALSELGAALNEEADAIMEVANLRIQLLQEEYDALERVNQAIQTEINRLTSVRDNVSGAFGSAISAVSGVGVSPSQTVADLQSQFGLATGEDKGAIGIQLASALQGQFDQTQALAAAGAISGEELQRIQAETLLQLEEAQAEAVSEFDQMIAVEEKQLAINETMLEELTGKMESIREEAIAQIEKLDEILQAIQRNDLRHLLDYLGGRIPQYASGTDYVPRTGMAIVHQGEQIIPQGKKQPTVVVNINGVPSSGATKESLTKAVREILIQNIGNFRGAVQRASR